MRIKSSVMPVDARSSGVSCACIVMEGAMTSVLASPARDSARKQEKCGERTEVPEVRRELRLSMAFLSLSKPLSTRNVSIPPNELGRIVLSASWHDWCEGSPRYVTAMMRGCTPRNLVES